MSARTRLLEISNLYKILRKNREQINDLNLENKNLEERIEYLFNVADNELKEEDKKEEEKQENGFTKWVRMSEELADFLEKPRDTLTTRTEIRNNINAYITKHKLKNYINITPDDKLKALLKIDDSVQLTYFNLQNYLLPHIHRTTEEKC